LRQESLGGTAEGKVAGNQQHAIGGNGEGRGRFHRRGIPHLGLTNTEERFFIPEVHFDIPALEVSFDDLTRFQFGVGANEKGGLAAKQLRTFAQAIGERGDGMALPLLPRSNSGPTTPYRGRQG
jgi:hypothetical protein